MLGCASKRGWGLTLIRELLLYPEVMNRVEMPLRIISDPKGAEILVDGKKSSIRTPGWLTYHPGEGVTVSLRKKGYSTVEHQIPPIEQTDVEKVVAKLEEQAVLRANLEKELTRTLTLDGAVEATPTVGDVYLVKRHIVTLKLFWR